MPRHVYTICSRLGSEDKFTGLVSLYHVIEALTMTRPLPGQSAIPFTFRITSVWMKEDNDDAEQEYEFRLLLRLPPDGREIDIANNRFRFNGPCRRIVSEAFLQSLVPDQAFEGLDGLGLMNVVCGIRPAGTQVWNDQSYPILLKWANPGELSIGPGVSATPEQ